MCVVRGHEVAGQNGAGRKEREVEGREMSDDKDKITLCIKGSI